MNFRAISIHKSENLSTNNSKNWSGFTPCTIVQMLGYENYLKNNKMSVSCLNDIHSVCTHLEV